MTARAFKARIAIIGVNPYVLVPAAQLQAIFKAANRERSPIPIRGELNRTPFKQTLVKYQGAWRLYLNTPMRRAIGKDVGDDVSVRVFHDPEPRSEPMPPALRRVFERDQTARAGFEALVPSRQKEILRYLNAIKTDATLQRNVGIVASYLRGGPANGLGGVLRAARPGPQKPRETRQLGGAVTPAQTPAKRRRAARR
jgi:hypothetical protein